MVNDMITFDSILGLIGTITGVVSLIWHIRNNRSKLKLESVYFQKDGFDIVKPAGKKIIGMRINFRNIGTRPTTVENINIKIGGINKTPFIFKPVIVSAGLSVSSEYILNFEEKEFLALFSHKPIEFMVLIKHTFGQIKQKNKNSFETGCFELVK